MGAAKEEFMNLRMSTEDYRELPKEAKEVIEIKSIDEDGHDYSEDELWCELNKASIKAYKARKKREFDLRHKTK